MLQHISIPRGPITLAADLYLPDDVSASESSPAIVLATPGSSVKEQIGANYASDSPPAGSSLSRSIPHTRGRATVNLVTSRTPTDAAKTSPSPSTHSAPFPGVDANRIGALGICAGGGYAVHTARTDHRIKALGTVVAGGIGSAFRGFQPEGAANALDALARARTEESARGESDVVNWLPDTLEDAAAMGFTDIDTTQAITYYRTPRGGNEHSTNRRLSRSDSLILGYDAFHLVDQLLTQPLQVIVAGRRGNTGQYESGMRLWELAPDPVDLLVIEGAGHYEMYDEPVYVDQAVERLTAFYRDHL